MNMYLHELKAYRKSTFIWTSSILVLVVLLFSMFPSFAREADEVKKLLEGFPEALRKAVGLEVESITSLLGFYSYVFFYITLCGAIQAMNLGTSIVSKEVREKTADFLLTKPVTRTQIITSKLLAAFTSLVITNIAFLIVAITMASYDKTESFSLSQFILISITLFFIQIMFMSLGVFLSVVLRKVKAVLPISLGTVFAFFFIGMFGATTGDEKVRYMTPFKYFEPSYIIKNSTYEWSYIFIGLGFVLLAIGLSYYIYGKKDIQAV
ncbi:ABC transporter permease subunit (plasmid) [Bacillus sp. 31A1R]|uniref:ABC transporter permease subunit n=1 Tax=Robertmurraya mangrovi TaxID=3098077 RepID=A0ABU5IVC4_9BACI|nr:ABC transporter permease subunit [Bacillus sp. 31A1R]MDZ5471099.1 ABC transporter permease subunit [Bacillus sp. 31A1R]